MGEVYRAIDTRLNRDVAIKVSAAQFSERFEREAEAIAALNHPNICQIYDVGPNYLVMEYIDGVPIVSAKDQQPLPPAEALRLATQIAAALEARQDDREWMSATRRMGAQTSHQSSFIFFPVPSTTS